MSAIPWHPNVNLHRHDPSNGGILTCPHIGAGSHVIKMKRGTLVQLNRGCLGILHELLLLDLHTLLGGRSISSAATKGSDYLVRSTSCTTNSSYAIGASKSMRGSYGEPTQAEKSPSSVPRT